MIGAHRRWLALAVLCTSLLAIVVDNTIVNVALPTLVSELEADVSELQWVVDAYTLVFAALLLLAVEGIAMYAVFAYVEVYFTRWAFRSSMSAAA